MKNMNVINIAGQRTKKFEREIRRYLKSLPEFSFEENGIFHTSSTAHLYLFNSILDVMHKRNDCIEKDTFPLMTIILYSYIHTHRNLNTDKLISKSEYMEEEIDALIAKHECVILWIYDSKFLHKPDQPFLRIICAINKNRKVIVPMQFSEDASKLYPKWFRESLKQKSIKKEDGLDHELLEMVKYVLS